MRPIHNIEYDLLQMGGALGHSSSNENMSGVLCACVKQMEVELKGLTTRTVICHPPLSFVVNHI